MIQASGRQRAFSRCLAGVLGIALTCLSFQGLAAFPAELRNGSGLPSLAPVLRQVTPAVVNISVLAREQSDSNPFLADPFFRRFFGHVEPESTPKRSAGSGVIVDARTGLVLTNHHVVENATAIQVTLKDRRKLDATLVGTDPETDIALLRIRAEGLVSASLGDSDQLEVGDFVLAIGNPFGLGQTVTSGIISALGRSGLDIEGYEDFIQTDASINPGNSGGPLIDLRGRVIGVNAAIIGPSGGNVGIGFAVPVNMAKAVMRQLQNYGAVRRGHLGVAVQDLTPELAEAMKLARDDGAVVRQVDAGSPADMAGLHPGDLIVTIDDRPVRDSADLRNQVGLIPAGEQVRLRVLRGREFRTLHVAIQAPDKATGTAGGAITPGLSGARLSDLAAEGMWRRDEVGVYVSEVTRGSPAWHLGLRAGDVIVGLNHRRLRSLADLRELGRSVARELALNVRRGDATLFLMIQ